MKLSIIVATRNRAAMLPGCLTSIAAALKNAAPYPAEIVVVDNGSADATSAVIEQWAATCPVPVRLLFEPQPGLARAHNRALRAAQGELLAFTDDDCRLGENYVTDLLRHDAGDSELVLRGGRIELGDPADLPLTIKTSPERMRWNRRANSARHQPITGQINGCNMTMRRAFVDRLGPFDERFGPGSTIGSGNDSDYLFRAYLAGHTLEYVPDMTVVHHHGRKTAAEGRRLLRSYLIANGAEFAKHGWKDPNLCRPFLWDVKNALRELLTGTNTCLPQIGFSHRDKVVYAIKGALRYWLLREADTALQAWEAEREEALFSSAAGRRIEALEAEGYRLCSRDGDTYHFVKGDPPHD
jgi:GT2 family glycosyltransferase